MENPISNSIRNTTEFIAGGVKLVTGAVKGTKALQALQESTPEELLTLLEKLEKLTPQTLDKFSKSADPAEQLIAEGIQNEIKVLGNVFPQIGVLVDKYQKEEGVLGTIARLVVSRTKSLNPVIGDKVQETVSKQQAEAEALLRKAEQANKGADILGLTGGTKVTGKVNISTDLLASIRKKIESDDLPTKIEGAKNLVAQVEKFIDQNPSAAEKYERSFASYGEPLGSEGLVSLLLEDAKTSIDYYKKDGTLQEDSVKYVSDRYSKLLKFLEKTNPVEIQSQPLSTKLEKLRTELQYDNPTLEKATVQRAAARSLISEVKELVQNKDPFLANYSGDFVSERIKETEAAIRSQDLKKIFNAADSLLEIVQQAQKLEIQTQITSLEKLFQEALASDCFPEVKAYNRKIIQLKEQLGQ